MSQDYSVSAKNLNNRKLQSSRSSCKINKNLVSQPPRDFETKTKNRIHKRSSNNSSVSKKRTKSFKRIKENEFRKILRPMQNINLTSDLNNIATQSHFRTRPSK